jgi:hypothetical protein
MVRTWEAARDGPFFATFFPFSSNIPCAFSALGVSQWYDEWKLHPRLYKSTMMNKCGSTPPRPPWWCPWSRSFSGGFFCVKADEIENQSFLTHEAIVHCAGQEWHDWHEHDWHAWQLDCAGTSSCSTGQRFVGGHPPLMPTPRFGRSEVKPKTWINLGRDFMYTII